MAIILAFNVHLTLKPTIIALDAFANKTSDSVIKPMFLYIILIILLSVDVDNFSNESVIASTDPSISPLIINFNSNSLKSSIRLPISSNVIVF